MLRQNTACRVGLLMALSVAILAPHPAGAQQRAPNREPYDLAMRCFLANGLAARSRTKQGDASGASIYEANAKTAFGVAGILGKALGISEQQTNSNITSMQTAELPRMMSEPGYFKGVIAACKAGGLA